MIIDNATIIGITIALIGSITVMCLFWKENIELTRQNKFLRERLRDKQK